MKLQTKIPLVKQAHNHIDYSSKIVLFGSCFAENISEKLEYFKFQNTVNIIIQLSYESYVSKIY